MLFFWFQTDDIFIKDYECHLPWMKNKTTKICPIIEEKSIHNEIILESLQTKVEKWRDIRYDIRRNKICPSGLKCNHPIYNMRTELTKSIDSKRATLHIQLESPIVQNVIDSYAYDSQSLVGEVGGTLGLFLGLSTYSLVEFITYFMEKFLDRQ